LLCFVLSGAAAAAGHRQRAQVAESTGRIGQAAREYEEAYGEEGAPDLLYRLGLVRRKMKQYELAQEAFRGYLRAAPEGPLRDEVTRQLSELGVFLDKQHRQVPDEQRKKPRPSRANVPVKGLTPPPTQPPANTNATGVAPQDRQSDFVAETASTTIAPSDASASPAAANDRPAPVTSSAPASPDFLVHPDAAPSGSGAAAPALAAPSRTAAPVAATAVGTTHSASSRSRAAPWLATGAAALAIGGAALWWDGDRTSGDLDSRYASGDLTGADGGRYARARRESIAGRAMVAGAAVLGTLAVALWW
jgi:hypothetical protein